MDGRQRDRKPKVVVEAGTYSEVTGQPELEERCEHPCHIWGHIIHDWKVTGLFSLTFVCKRCGAREKTYL